MKATKFVAVLAVAGLASRPAVATMTTGAPRPRPPAESTAATRATAGGAETTAAGGDSTEAPDEG